MKNTANKTSRFALGFLAAALAVSFSSCATMRKSDLVNHRAYEKTPDRVTSKVWRTMAKSNPATAKAAFYEKWGGPGNLGGKPNNKMDEGFRRHDLTYLLCDLKENLKAADAALVVWLENLDDATLNEEQLKYRERAIDFFQSPVAGLIGKPMVSLRKKEHDNCYFKSPEDVREFFEPHHPGFPDALAKQEAELNRSKAAADAVMIAGNRPKASQRNAIPSNAIPSSEPRQSTTFSITAVTLP